MDWLDIGMVVGLNFGRPKLNFLYAQIFWHEDELSDKP